MPPGRVLVKRCGTREALIAALVLLAACSRGKAPAPVVDAGAPEVPAAASSAPTNDSTARVESLAVDSIHRASAALGAWTGCEAGPGYGLLRRALGVVEPFARAGSRRATEVLYGPLRPADEGAGALGALDAALAAHDCVEARSQRFQIESALTLMSVEIVDGRRLGEAKTARALSDAAFDLGLSVLQARVSSSAFDEADRGEALGLTDAIEAGMKALWPDLDPAATDVGAIRSAIEQAPSMAALGDRARLTRMTGPIGLAIRAAARSHGLDVRPPYRSSTPTDVAVSALSLPPPRTRVDPDLAALGARLFTDSRLSARKKSSCATCHDPARAYTEPRATPISLDPSHPLLRNTPTLLYNDLAATQLWDGRIVTAEAQALRVVHNHAELGLDDAELVTRVSADPAYAAAFAARAGGAVTAAGIASALGAHLASLGPGTSPIDDYARGDDAALSDDIRHGLDVFAGPGRCARCHVPPLWGGSRPTDFAVPIYAVLGVPTRPEARVLDPDAGRQGVTHRPVDQGSFKTPSIRDLARTAPYMHHGRFVTLEQVVDFYDRGGGRGIGITVPNQDPDVRPLHLSAEDRRALLVFLRVGVLDSP
jgi:cytochrome c peroxidase